MITFLEWKENKERWIDLYLYLMEADSNSKNKGILQDKNYHNNLIKKLRILGLGEEANELEMIRLSQDDIDFGNSTIDSGQPNYYKRKLTFRTAYNTYLDAIGNLIKSVGSYIDKMGWKEDMEREYDKRFSNPPGFEYEY